MTDAARPLVSVIVPIYNVERYLDECLDSVRGQGYGRLEIIVVEDCSTDGSLTALQPHLLDSRVRLIRHEKNAGLSAARNTGIEAATGDFVMFVDSDDVISADLIEACVIAATAANADVLVYDCEAFQDGDRLPGLDLMTTASAAAEPIERRDYFALPHFAWLKFVRAPLLRDQTLRFPVGYYYEDWPFHWLLGFRARRIARLNGAWLGYRQRGTSITGSCGRKLLDQFAVQKMVLGEVRAEGDPHAGKVLAAKIYLGFWSVLLRIDSPLLAEAVNEARVLRKALRAEKLPPAPGLRLVLMDLALACPAWLATAAIRLLRTSMESGMARKLRGTAPATMAVQL